MLHKKYKKVLFYWATSLLNILKITSMTCCDLKSIFEEFFEMVTQKSLKSPWTHLDRSHFNRSFLDIEVTLTGVTLIKISLKSPWLGVTLVGVTLAGVTLVVVTLVGVTLKSGGRGVRFAETILLQLVVSLNAHFRKQRNRQ